MPLWPFGNSEPSDLSQIKLSVPEITTEDDADQSEEELSADEEECSFPARNSAQRQSLRTPFTTTEAPSFKPRKKIGLDPGYSALDWAKLKASGKDLRGGAVSMRRITAAEMAKHSSRDDAWSAYNGRVYNITPYLKFHPGGVQQLMRAAGKDGTELFMKTHAWISAENMLDSCLLGMLVRD